MSRIIQKEELQGVLNKATQQGLQVDQVVQDLINKGYQIQGLNAPNTQKEHGFFTRLRQSIQSVPERLQRGFGSQEVQEGRTEVSKGFDLADLPGDIADIIGPALPVTGGIIGGIAGAGATLPTGPGAVAGGAAGAAVTGGAFEGFRQQVGQTLNVEERFGGKQEGYDVGQIGREAALNVAGELGGAVIGRVGAKLLKPFAKRYLPDIAEIAQRRGFTLPASGTTDSPVVQITEQATQKGLFGGGLQEIVENADRQLTDQATKLVQSIGGEESLVVAGKSLTEGLESYRSTWMRTKGELYEQAAKALPEKSTVDVSATIGILDELLESSAQASKVLGKKAKSATLETIRKNLERAPSISEAKSALRKLNEITKFGSNVVETGEEAALRKVAATLDGDIMLTLQEVAPEAYDAASRADQFYKNGIEMLNSTYGKTIQKLADEPTQLVQKVIRPKSPEQVRSVFELIGSTDGGADRIANVQTAFLRNFFEEATNTEGSLATGKLLRQINKYGDETLEAVLGKDATTALKELAQIANRVGVSQRIAGGSQTAFTAKVQAIIVSLATGNIPLAASIAGGDAVTSRLFRTAAGRKWLTEGLTAPTIFEQVGAPLRRAAVRGVTDIVTSE